jgi:hypothetical protein
VDREAPARHLDLLIDTLAARQAATELPEAWADATLASLTVESYNLVAGKPEIATAFVTRLVTPTRPVELRCAGLERAGLLLAQWRSPATDLLPVLARSLEAAEPGIRVQAAHLLAALGSVGPGRHGESRTRSRTTPCGRSAALKIRAACPDSSTVSSHAGQSSRHTVRITRPASSTSPRSRVCTRC